MVPPGSDFPSVLLSLGRFLLAAPRVENQRWQGIDVGRDPSARMRELQNITFEVDLGGCEDLDTYRAAVRPNLPWADDHFLERVGRQPLNPGVEWANWPWGKSADRFRRSDTRFNHSYMERLWPRWARRTPGGRFDWGTSKPDDEGRQGIDRRYGDLDDLVDLLVKDPFGRQAFIPLFFPEDTGWGDGGRKMCSLGYHLIRRGDKLSIWYPLRSCDYVKHLRDDVYLAVRLLLWILGECRTKDLERWGRVLPGAYSMWMTSLHFFEADMKVLKEEVADEQGP